MGRALRARVSRFRDVQLLRAQKRRDQLVCDGGVEPVPLELGKGRARAPDALQSSIKLRLGIGEGGFGAFPDPLGGADEQAVARDRLANSGPRAAPTAARSSPTADPA